MKTQEEWFSEYAGSHENKTNQLIHYVCVPVIYFSIIGMVTSIPSNAIETVLNLSNPYIENWATIIFIMLMFFYIRLSTKTFVVMTIFSTISIFRVTHLNRNTLNFSKS